MTTIIAVQLGDDAIIGWDSMATRDNEQSSMVRPKFVVNNGIVFGVTGTTRASDILETMEVPEYEGGNKRKWVIRELVPVLRANLANEKALVNPDDESVNFGVLVVVDGEVFLLDALMSPLQTVEGIYTLGSGGDYARGALYWVRDKYRALDEEDVLDALHVASQIDPYTGGARIVTRARSYVRNMTL